MPEMRGITLAVAMRDETLSGTESVKTPSLSVPATGTYTITGFTNGQDLIDLAQFPIIGLQRPEPSPRTQPGSPSYLTEAAEPSFCKGFLVMIWTRRISCYPASIIFRFSVIEANNFLRGDRRRYDLRRRGQWLYGEEGLPTRCTAARAATPYRRARVPTFR